MTDQPDQSRKIGALWRKEGKGFSSGKLEIPSWAVEQYRQPDGSIRLDIIVFDNNQKRSNRSPDMNVLIQKPRDDDELPPF